MLLRPFRIANRCVTNAEWIEFIEDGGYETANLWLADGWNTIQSEAWRGPRYFDKTDAGFTQMSLLGDRTMDPGAPVTHVSFFEADAFARWAGCRLPSAVRVGSSFLKRARLGPHARRRPIAADRCHHGGIVHGQRRPSANIRRRLGVDTSVPISPIRASRPRLGPSANTTASSCAISSCSRARPAPRRRDMCGGPTGISSILISAGSSRAWGSQVTRNGKRPFFLGSREACTQIGHVAAPGDRDGRVRRSRLEGARVASSRNSFALSL